MLALQYSVEAPPEQKGRRGSYRKPAASAATNLVLYTSSFGFFTSGYASHMEIDIIDKKKSS
jgi:hypothetical protein